MSDERITEKLRDGRDLVFDTLKARSLPQVSLFKRHRGMAGAVLLGGIFLALLTAGFTAATEGIRWGVHVGKIEAGGMSKEDAREALEDQAATNFEEIRFVDGEENFPVPGRELDVSLDGEKTLDAAYAVGREGWFGERLSDTLRSYASGTEVPATVVYDEKKAREVVERLADEVSRKPKDATFHVTGESEVEVRGGQTGRDLDEERTLANLGEALDDLDSEVTLATTDNGEPEVSAGDLEELKPTELIGEYRTDYAWDSAPGRQANLDIASEAVDGTILAPGEVFSFNELAALQEYESAEVFSDGGVATEDGGGLCQVSSTLYMAASLAGLEMVERHPHYAVLPYIKPGFDATVWFGYAGTPELDMKFRNTTDGYLLVREYVDGEGFLNAEIHGRPTGKEVKMRSERVFEDPQRGIKWRTYKTVEQDGETIEDGVLHAGLYSYNPPPPEDATDHGTSAPRVAGWEDPNNTTGWADVQ
ncbi:MAG: VanW family protein [Rubrobacter sp.]|nr:VanW family protein [Rubrobacter sp.]